MMQFSDKRKGDISEMELCHFLLKEGLEVFKNISCTGLIDIITFNNETNEITLYDSKTILVSTRKDGTRRIYAGKTTAKQKEVGIKVAALYEGKLYTDIDKVGVNLDET